MHSLTALPVYGFAIFIAIVLSIEAGRRIGNRHLALDPEGARQGVGAIEGAVFGLLALLIAFTFSGAATRLDQRRALIVAETNAMGTAWLRLDLLPASEQPGLRQAFRDYVDARIEYYQDLREDQIDESAHARASALQQAIWKSTVAALQKMPTPTLGTSALQAQNEMIDITTTRAVAHETHPPLVIYLMLLTMALISALLIGYGMAGTAHRKWLHSLGYAAVMVCVLYVILDFEYPRFGIIRVDYFDKIMLDLRKSMD
ncbi:MULTISPECIES: DUF4239 domain-containing protein [unclassified Pseudomonas]|jgi:hypothetical protein|uniref:bestrophin-like domain n=1 Tax=unclassified Pseudomonas TaxID=196821 RepID=UPI000876F62E|nr:MULTISPECIES: DUF4239 domain-containing protein [unclassified Pseudomonas]MDB6442265.1 DUF4239 domain-containing protein [Pseudomonas sp. 21TX0197]ROO41546.1 DUF4239 domain-containing protein [Pseudomonas sp. AF76]ROO42168.1 DUF4239 domain-containing protein [Pseudomonas sp. 7SR1]SCX47955.1 hypothetical protein SAMN03159507_00907 [Pseudomonas sp. NFACC32-1]SFW35905.1 hypothetical protein SAMN03159376_01154 [Pseudomonas sp. NFACC09-4]